MKVLVTGASGFVGKAVVERLSADNFEIYVLLNSRTSDKNHTKDLGDSRIIYADITDYGNVEKLFGVGKMDAVIHCAGLAHQFGDTAESAFWKVNVEGTGNVAKLAVRLQARRFILISSVAVYGKAVSEKSSDEAEPVTEDWDCQPDDFYSRSKLASERVAKAICSENKIELTILRPSTVIGENDRGNVARLIKMIDQGRFFWIGSGKNLKSLVYKEDVARACLCVLTKKRPIQTGEIKIYNVSAEALPMRDIVSEIHRRLQKKNPRVNVSPALLEPFFLLNRKTLNIGIINKLYGTLSKWLSDDVYSGDKIREQYGFEIETPLPEAIRREVESYKRLQ
jgi:nucleoside-diphosphate-sugar epimerase